MPAPFAVTFLGTSAGSGPSVTRNTSSILLNLGGPMWLVDCAEGTQRQLQFSGVKGYWTKLDRIFITHMHLDHTCGIAPLISNLMSAISQRPPVPSDRPHIQLYAPPGLRLLLRTQLSLSHTVLAGKYCVHELLRPSIDQPSASCTPEDLHANEAVGRDIWADEDGVWRGIVQEDEADCAVRVDAGPILHRVPCLGYIFCEPPQPSPIPKSYLSILDDNADALASEGIAHPRSLLGRLTRDRQTITLPDGTVLEPPALSIPGRTLAVLGDTADPSAILPLLKDNEPSLLVHECTNAYVPVDVDRYMGGERTTRDKLRAKAASRGHSTPEMAGEFARHVKARRLFLNHFGLKFQAPGPPPFRSYMAAARRRVMTELEDQASEAWGMGRAVCAEDFLTVEVLSHDLELPPVPSVSHVPPESVGTTPLAPAGTAVDTAERERAED